MSTLEEKEAIRELLAEYCFRFDNGEFDAWLELFTADGVFDLGARGRMAGHDALRQFLQRIPLTNGLPMLRHSVTNWIVRVDRTQATAWSYVVVVHGGAALGLTLAGRYEDQLTKVEGAWRFRERKVHFDLIGTAP